MKTQELDRENRKKSKLEKESKKLEVCLLCVSVCAGVHVFT